MLSLAFDGSVCVRHLLHLWDRTGVSVTAENSVKSRAMRDLHLARGKHEKQTQLTRSFASCNNA